MRTKINWYVNRLLAMSIPEIFYRLQQAIQVFQEHNYGLPKGVVYTSRQTASQAWSEFNAGTRARFYWDPNDRHVLAQEMINKFPGGYQATLLSSGKLMEHCLEIFGESFTFGKFIDWQIDPKTWSKWPQQFWAGIDIRDASKGGVKWVWEINRHHHILTLAKAYFLTHDERYAHEALAQISSWIDQNPPLFGINWTSSLELSIRLINWIWVLEFVKDSKHLSEELFHTINRSISQQSVYVSRHLSAYSSANNHRVGEAAGLAMVGIAFPWLNEAEKWKRSGLEILTQEITKLILADGSSAEQAPHYLLFILDFYLLVMQLAKINRINLDPIWAARLQAAALFIKAMMDQQGHVPSIGDNDDAWVVRLDNGPEVNNYGSVLATCAAIFHDPRVKFGTNQWDEKSAWLLEEDGEKDFDNLGQMEPRPISKLMQPGGYFIMEAPGSKVIADCGPLGYEPIAAHGHADALSIWATFENEAFLVNSGTFAYQEGGSWRTYFRSASAHNTLRIDGIDQSEMLGPFLWGKKAKSNILNWDIEDGYEFVEAEHDGYKKLGVTHRRITLFLKPDILVVSDQIFGKGSHQIEQFWHLAPEYKVKILGNKAELAIRQHRQEFEVLSSPFDNLRVVEGQLNPIQGWVSNRYGQKTPAPVLIHSGVGTLPVGLVTIFYPEYLSQVEVNQTKIKVRMILERKKLL